MEKKTCIVAGALGIAGRALIEDLDGQPDWEIIGLSRRAPDFSSRATFISVDLLDREDCKLKLGGLAGVTHVLNTAHAPRASVAEEVAPDLAMLTNLVTTIEAASPTLRHVQLLHGTKWYGNHLGPFRTPAKEDDPRHMPPNFYDDQQDWIASTNAASAGPGRHCGHMAFAAFRSAVK